MLMHGALRQADNEGQTSIHRAATMGNTEVYRNSISI